MITLKGAEVSAKIKEQVLAMNGKLGGYVPTAAIVRIGERPDDLSYERNVMKRIAAYGMETMSYVYPADITEEEFFAEFQKINDDEAIDGILLFRPLPKYINEKRAEQMIRPEKDLDGICAVNTAKVFAGEKDGFAPCTAEAVIEVLKAFDIPMEGKRAVIVGRSMVVGRPLSMLMLKENATVTVCHTKTKDLKAVCREADILVAAAGKAKMLDASFLKEGAVLIDVGINVDENGKLCGDVLWEGLEEKASAVTPVTKKELMERGVKLGADVPYCIMRGTALSEGIGEILTELPAPPQCHLVIAKPQISVSTKAVYGKLRVNELASEEHPDIDGMMAAIKNGDLDGVIERLGNVLETVTVPDHPEISEIKEIMVENGACGSLMSGSGPTVFGIYKDRELAEKACQALREADGGRLTRQVYLTEFYNRKKAR